MEMNKYSAIMPPNGWMVCIIDENENSRYIHLIGWALRDGDIIPIGKDMDTGLPTEIYLDTETQFLVHKDSLKDHDYL